ncbi:low-complexity tail membrane protein, partial [Aphanothece stagnina]
MTPRSEPLLWLQLIALGAIPLELLLLLLVLAGADPGPLPALERLLALGLGSLAPSLLLWRQPPDCCSLLLAQVPLRGRTPAQLKLSALQDALGPRLLGLLGPVALLPLFWSLDSHAALATALSPLAQSNRLVVLILAIPLLALLVWQWQQLVQSLWLLSRSEADLDAATALRAEDLSQRRICLGLPLLLLEPLPQLPQPRGRPVPPAAPASTGGAEPPAGATIREPSAPATASPAPEAEAGQIDATEAGSQAAGET